jgi:DNA (cytosine-5)-methyltransferase 1
LQGFAEDWTLPAVEAGYRQSVRWRLVGNAVSVPVTTWLGQRLCNPAIYIPNSDAIITSIGSWPKAAWSMGGAIHAASVSTWPIATSAPELMQFLNYGLRPLSYKATAGFYSRAKRSTLRFAPGFLAAVEAHMHKMGRMKVAG